MKPLLLLLVLLGVATAPRAVKAASSSPAYAIRTEDAARAVLAVHPELAGDAVELPTRIETRTEAPILEAGSLERLAVPSTAGAISPGTATGVSIGRIRIHCRTESACLPFYVWVHLPASDASTLQQGAPAGLPDHENVSPLASEPVLRTGAHAFMVIDSGLLHLRIPVICLQSGAVGTSIRVAGPTHGRVYQVAIVDQSTVRGSL